MDNDSDSLFDVLRVNVGLDVQIADTYTFIAELAGTNNIDTVRKIVPLTSGSHNITLDFIGQQVYQNHENGPYDLKSLRVQDSSGNVIDFISDAYSTASYLFTEYQHYAATLNISSISDQGIDIDSNGDYEYLRISIQLDGEQGKSYRILSTLSNLSGNQIETISFEITTQTIVSDIDLDFPGGAISSYGVNGPYQLTSLALLNSYGTILDFYKVAYTTSAYSSTDFSAYPITYEGAKQDQARDIDNDNIYEYLDIDFDVTSSVSGVVIAIGSLIDSDGQVIGWLETNVNVISGITREVTFSFNGGTINEHGKNGPYKLDHLLVFHTSDPTQDVYVEHAYTTSAYNYQDFEPPQVFSDVYPDHWAFEWIEAIAAADLTSGYPDGTYRPENRVTRAEMAVFLLNALGITPGPLPLVPSFNDIPGHWAETFIEELKDQGITGGYPDGTYRPENRVTRAEMAVFLLKGIGVTPPPIDGSHPFSDIEGHWAEIFIEELEDQGITGGYPDGTYRPENRVTRAEMAVFLVNAFGLPLP